MTEGLVNGISCAVPHQNPVLCMSAPCAHACCMPPSTHTLPAAN